MYAAKLAALVGRLPVAVPVGDGDGIDYIDSPGRAGGISRRQAMVQGYLLLEGESAGSFLGPALLWAGKHGVSQLTLIIDGAGGDLARRWSWFAASGTPPTVTVWEVAGTELRPALPSPLQDAPDLSDEVWALAGIINESGARAVDDHGRLVAELAGLEIARVSVDDGGTPLLEVGVGRADRELHQLVHADLDPDTALRRAAGLVAIHRRPGAAPHPLNRLARERWLRSLLLENASLIGATGLEPVPPLRPRSTLLGTQPVAAVGSHADGRPLIAVCSVGVDPDLVPEAADYRARFDPGADLVVVLPERDRYPITEQLVARLPRATMVSAASPWE